MTKIESKPNIILWKLFIAVSVFTAFGLSFNYSIFKSLIIAILFALVYHLRYFNRQEIRSIEFNDEEKSLIVRDSNDIESTYLYDYIKFEIKVVSVGRARIKDVIFVYFKEVEIFKLGDFGNSNWDEKRINEVIEKLKTINH
jgi:hypothetical protein